MADIEQQSALHEESNLTDPSEIIAIVSPTVVDGSEMAGDILQQALDEVSEGFQEGSVAYANGSLADGSLAITQGDDNVTTLVGDAVSCVDSDGTATYTYVMADQTEFSVDSQHVSDVQTVSTNCEEGNVQFVPDNLQMVQVDNNELQWTSENGDPQPAEQTLPPVEVDDQPLGTSANPIRIIQQGNQYTSLQQLTPEQLSQIMQVVQQQQLLKTTRESGGSSVLYNPQTQTRIVYKVIYPSDLHGKSDNKGATTARGYVVDNSTGVRQISVPTDSVTVMTGINKRTYRKRKNLDGDLPDGPQLSREEREARKRRKLRTRSGRVSRPPKHMIKDYKHIHPVDLNEDPYDDSDGGYSDFKLSEGEKEDADKDEKADNYNSSFSLGSSKPKNFKCEKCDKAYIGKAGLARHFRIFPDHCTPGAVASTSQDGMLACSASNDFDSEHSTDSLVNAHTMQAPDSGQSHDTNKLDDKGLEYPVLGDEDKDNQTTNNHTLDNHSLDNHDGNNHYQKQSGENKDGEDNSPSFKGTLAPFLSPEENDKSKSEQLTSEVSIGAPAVQKTTVKEVIKTKPPKKDTPHHRLKANVRARQAYMQELAPNRRKQKLRELMKQCSDEELMETVLPRLASVITLWEFLLMKVEEEVESSRAPIEDIIDQYHALTKQVRKAVNEQLQQQDNISPADNDTERGEEKGNSHQTVQITSADLSSCLGISTGSYRVKPTTPAPVPPLQYKFMTANPANSTVDQGGQHRVVEVVSRDELVPPPIPSKHTLLQHTLSSLDNSNSNETHQPVIDSCQVLSDEEAPPMKHESSGSNEYVALDGQLQASTNSDYVVTGASMAVDSIAESSAMTQSVTESHMEAPQYEEGVEMPQPLSTSPAVVSDGIIMQESNNDANSVGSSLHDNSLVQQPQQQQMEAVSPLDAIKMNTMLLDCSENVILVRSPFEEVKMEIRNQPHPVHSQHQPISEPHVSTHQQMVSLLNGNIVKQETTDFSSAQEYASPQKMITMSHDVSKVNFHGGQVLEEASQGRGESGDQVVNGDLVTNGLASESMMEGTQVYVEDGQCTDMNGELEQETISADAEIYQTTDGLILIRNPDGTIQIHGPTENGIPMETVEALLAMGPGSHSQMDSLQTVDNT